VWYNTDRRQERWVNSLFAQNEASCVQTLRSFEESLLAAMTGDISAAKRESIDLRIASPSAEGFAGRILGVQEMEDATPEWQDFLSSTEAKVMVATFRTDQPVMAFLNDRHELQRTYGATPGNTARQCVEIAGCFSSEFCWGRRSARSAV
ncbi:MAG: hypothetical protein WCJ09_15305, partial [Planctomycetota bacterium]